MPPASTPPQVITLEGAWRDVMKTLAIRHPNKVNAAKITLRVLRSQMRAG